MFSILAEIKIPDVYSPWSALSIVGIMYFLICFYLFCKHGVISGMATNSLLLIAGLLFVIVVNTEDDGTGMFSKRLIDKNDRNLTISQVEHFEIDILDYQEKIEAWKNPDTPRIDPDEDFTTIWAINDPTCEYYLCSPWVFHPSCVVWCPLIICLPLIGFVSNWKNK